MVLNTSIIQLKLPRKLVQITWLCVKLVDYLCPIFAPAARSEQEPKKTPKLGVVSCHGKRNAVFCYLRLCFFHGSRLILADFEKELSLIWEVKEVCKRNRHEISKGKKDCYWNKDEGKRERAPKLLCNPCSK
jgi:hypothetical protein